MRTRGIALGDYDGDGDLDLALGNSSLTSDDYNRIYSNNGSGAFSLAWTAPITADTYSVAWADYDRDGDLDLAVGNLGLGSGGQANQIYRNDGSNTFVAVWTSPDSNQTRSLAWADFDSDGDLDLAVGNYDAPNQIYRNDTQPGDLAPNLTLIWEAPGGAESTYEVAWGDCDGDGDPDLVSGNYDRPNLLYRNDGTSDNGEWRFSLSWMTNVARKTTSLAWSDYDSDGDLDLTEGTFDEGIHIYVNQGNDSFDDLPISSLNTNDIAWGDADGDGDLDLSAVPGLILENTHLGREQMPDNPPSLNIAPPHGIANANFYASPVIVDSPVISIPFSVFDPEGQPVGHIEGSYSLDGGGQWHPALAASGSATTNL
ncbi:MAG TPA: hypothetical protein DEH22_03230, partial [Chloroflexi bacterium]|nr:hypothetical protein [Chloroflexota bacterium]